MLRGGKRGRCLVFSLLWPCVLWQVEALRDALQELERELEEAKRDMSELVDDRQSVSGW